MFINLTAIIQSANQSPKYPSSSKKVRDWEKLENELKKIEEEEAKKPTGDHLRNRDVQYAYSKLSDNEKRALVKSYVSIAFFRNFKMFKSFLLHI